MKNKFSTFLKIPFHLGFKSVGNYAIYKFGLHSGYYKTRTPDPDIQNLQTRLAFEPRNLLHLPDRDTLRTTLGNSLASLSADSEALARDQYRFFDAELQQLDLSPHSTREHWTAYERGKTPAKGDIKFIWEPARFGWLFLLSRAHYLNPGKDDQEWLQNKLRTFQQENPAFHGANWTSAQESALRIMALCFMYHVFADTGNVDDNLLSSIKTAIALNALRIAPTLSYARAQRNNHLLSEAVGLYTAGVFLDGFSPAKHWERTGWRVFNHAIRDQISEDGTYIQHSSNYQRLMLDLALWMDWITRGTGTSLPAATLRKLALSTQNLCDLVDKKSGFAANLGHQDGSNILPLAQAEHLDFRPVLQAASRAFLQADAFPPGPWDEKAAWLNLPPCKEMLTDQQTSDRLVNEDGWASIRAVRYHSRPAHADQLHVEIWHGGQNIAKDAGTYLYNAPPPWQNALRSTRVHNTITIDDIEQMAPVSRFLWLDWAQAEITNSSPNMITARHNGYTRLGITHHRSLRKEGESNWQIVDSLTTKTPEPRQHYIKLHWLVGDELYQIKDNTIHSSASQWSLIFEDSTEQKGQIILIRAGEFIHGTADFDPLLYGWFSPTYGVKQPVISILYVVKAKLPLELRSTWVFHNQT